MKRLVALATAGLVAVGTLAAAPANEQSQAADHTLELSVGDSGEVVGGQPGGMNVDYFGQFGVFPGATCTKDAETYCETVLVRLENPYEEENARKGRERANLLLELSPTAPSDFDLVIYESDEDGTQGTEIGRDASFPQDQDPIGTERATVVVTTTEEETVVWVLVHVVYFAATSNYTLTADFA